MMMMIRRRRMILLLLCVSIMLQLLSPAHSFSLPKQQTSTSSSHSAISTTSSTPLTTTTTIAATTTIITIPTTTTITASSSSNTNKQSPKPTTTVAVTIRQATLPNDLLSIQACRRSAYPNNKNVDTLLSAAKSFCNADQIQRPGYVCFIATAAATSNIDANIKDSREEEEEEGVTEVVLGTADYNVKTGIVNNVYVRDYARKNGLAELMMQAVESYHHSCTAAATTTATTMGKTRQQQVRKRRPLKLTVASSNIPAISLYKKLGFEAKGAYGLLDGLSSAIPALNFLMEMEK